MWLPLLGLLLGFLVGQSFSFTLPAAFAPYLSVAILSTLDSALGGVKGVLYDQYDSAILMTGFFINSALSVLLLFLGNLIGADLFYVAIFVFGIRIFQNFAIIRRSLIERYILKRSAKKEVTPNEVS